VSGDGRVVIVGAGVIGLSCAHYLLERGRPVTVLERGGPDRDCCSLGNAGFISPSHILPLAAPGVVGQALRWMPNPESPIYVRPRLDARFFAWGLRFWRAADDAKRAHRAGPLLRDLNLQSRALYQELADATGNEFEMAREGLLMLFRSPEGLEREAGHAAYARELGMPVEILDAKQTAAREPGLTLDVHGGVYYPLDAHVTPQRFVAALARKVVERGGSIAWEREARGWKGEGSRLRAAVTADGEIEGEEFVLAAGAWTGRVARRLGLRLPLEPGKGYSLTLDAPRERPRGALLLEEARVAVTPMGSTLRVGGTMELAGFDPRVHPPRVRGILRSLTRYLPAFRLEDFAPVRPWFGYRPLSPDGLPYVGRTGKFENLSVATGHAMMGLSMGPITGKLIAEVICGERPSVDLELLRPDRYA
jgi:D-amino-acid dehydrogenase